VSVPLVERLQYLTDLLEAAGSAARDVLNVDVSSDHGIFVNVLGDEVTARHWAHVFTGEVFDNFEHFYMERPRRLVRVRQVRTSDDEVLIRVIEDPHRMVKEGQ